MTDFNPNEPADLARVRGDVAEHRWATYIEHYHGKNRGPWKTHRRLREARAAIDASGWKRIVAYERVDGEWVERLDYAPRTSLPLRNPGVCRVCGGAVDENDTWRRYPRWSPDEDFAKVHVHWGCSRKLEPRKERDS